ncbi:hypothetical protein E2562_016175 [Oryza meyeriana var. granulata]|uniref:Uncharacterized protein n=1 Tax=Oryza meyeriana var. granulata TaxID=110450 RepID=A0A6G1F8I8_9ORYZ|nr:hypothetical protein E2562_016175 [Oryza meyeriana var. granulata]
MPGASRHSRMLSAHGDTERRLPGMEGRAWRHRGEASRCGREGTETRRLPYTKADRCWHGGGEEDVLRRRTAEGKMTTRKEGGLEI